MERPKRKLRETAIRRTELSRYTHSNFYQIHMYYLKLRLIESENLSRYSTDLITRGTQE